MVEKHDWIADSERFVEDIEDVVTFNDVPDTVDAVQTAYMEYVAHMLDEGFVPAIDPIEFALLMHDTPAIVAEIDAAKDREQQLRHALVIAERSRGSIG